MKIKNISKEAQIVDWVEVKAWWEIETVHAYSILINYPNLFKEVKKEEVKEEVKEEKKSAKKSK